MQEFLKRRLPGCFQVPEGDVEAIIRLSTDFIQYCVYPRLMFSASDALYAFQFLRMLQTHRVPNFNILQTFA